MELESSLEVNKLARRIRHLKSFSRSSLSLKNSWELLVRTAYPLRSGFSFLDGLTKGVRLFVAEALPASPKGRILFKASALTMAFMVVSSLSMRSTGGFVATSYHTYSNEYLSAYLVPGDVLVTDEQGYLVKANPQTANASRIGLTDTAIHTVENGETLSVIAERYGVNVETIMWENNLNNANSLRIGQKLVVPPVNGLSYQVRAGDTLEKIASKYEISVDAIIAQNALENDILHKGGLIFLPDAKQIAPVITLDASRNSTKSRDKRIFTASSSDATPAAGKVLIWPTLGNVSQGFHGGHYALDIADRGKPPVWAAAGGTVIKASTGTWGGGYGNHVIIDHGDGLQTLYAHMDSLSVYEGQELGQGDVVGQMGNTGRVYGATGIHLHFEVIKNGVKQNPWNYF